MVYHFTSKGQKEFILAKYRSSNCIWIESKGGMGGSTLKKFLCNEKQSKSLWIKNIEVCDFVSIIQNVESDNHIIET